MLQFQMRQTAEAIDNVKSKVFKLLITDYNRTYFDGFRLRNQFLSGRISFPTKFGLS